MATVAALTVLAAAAILLRTSWFLVKISYQTISFYWLSPQRIKKIMEKQGVRGPKPRPLVGNLHEMASLVSSATSDDLPSIHHDLVPRLLPHYVLWSKKYDTNMIKELLSNYSYSSGKSWLQQQGSKNFIGCGLLMANGDDWHRQRRLVAPAFMGDKLKGYAGNVVDCTRSMVQSLEADITSGRTEVEIGGVMARLTADIISRIEFGSSFEKGKRIFQLLTTLQHRCAQASQHLCLPGSRFFPSKYNNDIKALKEEVERLLEEIIESRTNGVEIGRSDCHGNDLIGILLDGMLENNKKGKDGLMSLNKQLIMDECKTFFFAGHETTALLLTWTVMLLASNPVWQDKVREEVAQVCNGSPPCVNHLPRLSSLNLVINESLRLYPPATVLPRMAFEDIKLGDLLIPKGLSIWIPVLAIHHSKELWGDDANEFNPQRFASKAFMPGRFIPFGAGPRNCIGQAFAMLEAKIILATLVSRFRFSISDNYQHAPVVILTIKPKYGVQIRLEPLP
ncbi:Cytokinin hydroxylase-like protein [Drosera capensis]